MKIPIITLYQPWASWISLGWKTIETRLHPRFGCLVGRTIGIHAGFTWDKQAYTTARDFLIPFESDKHEVTTKLFTIRGSILCTAKVVEHRELNQNDSQKALIYCGTIRRYGLVLADITPLAKRIDIKGKMGIWYYDIGNDADSPSC